MAATGFDAVAYLDSSDSSQFRLLSGPQQTAVVAEISNRLLKALADNRRDASSWAGFYLLYGIEQVAYLFWGITSAQPLTCAALARVNKQLNRLLGLHGVARNLLPGLHAAQTMRRMSTALGRPYLLNTVVSGRDLRRAYGPSFFQKKKLIKICESVHKEALKSTGDRHDFMHQVHTLFSPIVESGTCTVETFINALEVYLSSYAPPEYRQLSLGVVLDRERDEHAKIVVSKSAERDREELQRKERQLLIMECFEQSKKRIRDFMQEELLKTTTEIRKHGASKMAKADVDKLVRFATDGCKEGAAAFKEMPASRGGTSLADTTQNSHAVGEAEQALR